MNYKIKPLTKNQIIISIDRLTRFKNTQDKYLRVFNDIIVSNLITPKYSKSELEKMNSEQLTCIAQDIINYSLQNMGVENSNNYEINEKLCDYETNLFVCSDSTLKLLDNKINYFGIASLLDDEILPENLVWFKSLLHTKNVKNSRQNLSCLFPVEKLLLVEGATEEILLPEFAKICDYDFNKNGIFILPAGGKNQVVKLYYQYAECLKIPIFVLLDKDGFENSKEIKSRLRKNDEIYLLKCGEFEDLLPHNLVKKIVKDELKNISVLEEETLVTTGSCVKFLEEIFKNRGMHEFKKVEFAQMVKNYIKSTNDITKEVKIIIEKVKGL